ncbi:MAG: hypothetical protein Ct9H300mP11_02270 [Chloroflexota bacterium]|nr:MAG: hypothetical protein Ct9H300mP11_02270 [Chloroflexota bacterium]
MSPAHLKQHQLLGQGVLVVYKKIEDRLVFFGKFEIS